jgi:hypothetical protein
VAAAATLDLLEEGQDQVLGRVRGQPAWQLADRVMLAEKVPSAGPLCQVVEDREQVIAVSVARSAAKENLMLIAGSVEPLTGAGQLRRVDQPSALQVLHVLGRAENICDHHFIAHAAV